MSAKDFDFLHGSWRIEHRYLTERLAGCDEWVTFESTMRCWPILGGAANMDEGYFPSRDRYGMTIRLYDKGADTWSLYWIDSTRAGIEPPVTGRFDDGVGTFLGPDAHNGAPVVCRYIWSDITPDSVRWAQALSPDDGATWETNWIMELTRADEDSQAATLSPVGRVQGRNSRRSAAYLPSGRRSVECLRLGKTQTLHKSFQTRFARRTDPRRQETWRATDE